MCCPFRAHNQGGCRLPRVPLRLPWAMLYWPFRPLVAKLVGCGFVWRRTVVVRLCGVLRGERAESPAQHSPGQAKRHPGLWMSTSECALKAQHNVLCRLECRARVANVLPFQGAQSGWVSVTQGAAALALGYVVLAFQAVGGEARWVGACVAAHRCCAFVLGFGLPFGRRFSIQPVFEQTQNSMC